MVGWLGHGAIIKHGSGREGISANPAINGPFNSLKIFETLHGICGSTAMESYIIHLRLNSKS